MYALPFPRWLPLLLCLLPLPAAAQFVDNFDRDSHDDYLLMTGDGTPTMTLTARDGHGRIAIDATRDRHNVWWTILKRDVSDELDLALLSDPAYALRVEARVKISAAPRRVNFMVVTQRTTDFHQHLREFDIADTTAWHTISMLTRDLDVRPNDTLYVQFCATDLGPATYVVELDYFRADVVRTDEAGPEQGEPLVYHPDIPELSTFGHALPVAESAVVSPEYPEVNFGDWGVRGESGAEAPVVTVAREQYALLRWDLTALAGRRADGAGVLELTTQSLASGGRYRAAYGDQLGEEFPKVRIVEVLGGNPAWRRDAVTWENFLQSGREDARVNGQMVSDVTVTPGAGGKTYVTLSRPVLQRLLDGTTTGLIVQPLGLITASFYADTPTLHLNLTETAAGR